MYVIYIYIGTFRSIRLSYATYWAGVVWVIAKHSEREFFFEAIWYMTYDESVRSTSERDEHWKEHGATCLLWYSKMQQKKRLSIFPFKVKVPSHFQCFRGTGVALCTLEELTDCVADGESVWLDSNLQNQSIGPPYTAEFFSTDQFCKYPQVYFHWKHVQ